MQEKIRRQILLLQNYKKEDILKMTKEILESLNIKYNLNISDEYLMDDFSVFVDILNFR